MDGGLDDLLGRPQTLPLLEDLPLSPVFELHKFSGKGSSDYGDRVDEVEAIELDELVVGYFVVGCHVVFDFVLES